MQAQINLHELANMPGYGCAEIELAKAGLAKYPERALASYSVRIQAALPVTAYVQLRAGSERHARELALALVRDREVDWDDTDAPEGVFIKVSKEIGDS